MSPTGAVPNGNYMYQYLPRGQENVVEYDGSLWCEVFNPCLPWKVIT